MAALGPKNNIFSAQGHDVFLLDPLDVVTLCPCDGGYVSGFSVTEERTAHIPQGWPHAWKPLYLPSKNQKEGEEIQKPADNEMDDVTQHILSLIMAFSNPLFHKDE